MAERQHLRALGGAELEPSEEEFIFVGQAEPCFQPSLAPGQGHGAGIQLQAVPFFAAASGQEETGIEG